MSYNLYFDYNITRGHLPCLIMTFQKVFVASTFLKPEGEAASGSPHSISCQRKTIGPTGPKFSAPINEMHTEQQKKTEGRYCCGGGSYSHISSGQFLARILYLGLRKGILHGLNTLSNKSNSDGSSVELTTFLVQGKKKGSKKFR